MAQGPKEATATPDMKWENPFIAAVATGIGLIPVLFGSRRLNCLGILLLPIACNMSGFGPKIAAFLGLV